MVLICPAFLHNKTYDGFVNHNSLIFVINCPQEEVEFWLKLSSHFFQGMKSLIVLDDCAASKDVKGQTGQLVSLGFPALHAGISVWIFTLQITSISKPFRENVAAIVLFYTPSGKTMKAIFEGYAGELSPEEYKELIAESKREKFPYLVFALRFP